MDMVVKTVQKICVSDRSHHQCMEMLKEVEDNES